MLRITSVLKRNRWQDGVIITLHKTKFSQQKRQSQEDRQKVFLTLPDLSLLVPTVLSKGGGGGLAATPNISRTTEPRATKLCTILGYCMRTQKKSNSFMLSNFCCHGNQSNLRGLFIFAVFDVFTISQQRKSSKELKLGRCLEKTIRILKI